MKSFFTSAVIGIFLGSLTAASLVSTYSLARISRTIEYMYQGDCEAPQPSAPNENGKAG